MAGAISQYKVADAHRSHLSKHLLASRYDDACRATERMCQFGATPDLSFVPAAIRFHLASCFCSSNRGLHLPSFGRDIASVRTGKEGSLGVKPVRPRGSPAWCLVFSNRHNGKISRIQTRPNRETPRPITSRKLTNLQVGLR